MSAPAEAAIVKAAEMVENQFGAGLYLEALAANGVRWSTQEEQDALIKMGQEVLACRPDAVAAANQSSRILKVAGQLFGRQEPPKIDLDSIVDRAMADYPELGTAASTYLEALQAAG